MLTNNALGSFYNFHLSILPDIQDIKLTLNKLYRFILRAQYKIILTFSNQNHFDIDILEITIRYTVHGYPLEVVKSS